MFYLWNKAQNPSLSK